MFVHDKHELFADEPLVEHCTLHSGKIIVLRAMSPADLRELRIKTKHVDPDDNQTFAYYGIVQCAVHPETGEPLFTESDIPMMAAHMHLRDLYVLTNAFNRMHGFVFADEEPDPVKKPQTVSAIDMSGIVSRVNGEFDPMPSEADSAFQNLQTGTPTSSSTTTKPIIAQP